MIGFLSVVHSITYVMRSSYIIDHLPIGQKFGDNACSDAGVVAIDGARSVATN